MLPDFFQCIYHRYHCNTSLYAIKIKHKAYSIGKGFF